MLAPLILVWCAYAPISVYLYFYFPWSDLDAYTAFAVLFGSIFLISYLISLASFILLEQIRTIENGQSPGLGRPLSVGVWNSFRALHVTLIWAFIWFLITVAEIILRSRDETDPSEQSEPTAQNVAEFLAGAEQFSFSGMVFDGLRKGVRMIAFLIFPAIAWERYDKPIRRGLGVAMSHKGEFASGFLLTEAAAGVVFIPPFIVFMLADQTDVPFPDWTWFAVIIYCGFAWSFAILLEQLFTAELYLWDMKWRKACEAAVDRDAAVPELADVKRPSILDDVPDMKAD
ncbi:hypothetical protein DDZ18_04695 [Marinicauda salina]|uniref:Uncharacterized protein n=1 Tax=Marinicauda salina TaxID=2135793 RepID=A0A2U2BY07_9PROT|nr:hypothetical protein DDZ18_04695 [Marinicauda salina]